MTAKPEMTTNPSARKILRGELDAAELLQQHAYDVGTPGRSLLPHDEPLPDTDPDGTHDAGEQQVVGEVEMAVQKQRGIERLDSRLVGIDQPGEDVHETGRIERGHDGTCTEMAAENPQSRQHERHVEHVTERTDLDRGEDIVQDDAHAIDAAGNEVVGIDEENEPRAHDRTAQQNKNPRAPPRPRAHRLKQRLGIHSNKSLGMQR